MNSKRFLLILLLIALLIILLPGFVSAGCCLMPNEGQGCRETSDPVNECAASTQEYRDESCNLLSECNKGCCCPTGIGSRNISCRLPFTFIEDPSVEIGVFCSCGGPTYTISGTVRDYSNNPLGGAIVSARGISNVSLPDGTFVLNRVPSGAQIDVSARKDGCLSAMTTISLTNNQNNVLITLNCVCAAGSCRVTETEHAFCASTNNWQYYDPVYQNTAWCGLCRDSDPVNCQQAAVCNGGDGSCPLSCSNVPGATDSSGNSIYDSDCVCDPINSNGVCPASCCSTCDRDCIVLNPDCGNGFIEFPESCDFGSPGNPPAEGQINLCSADECTNCNCYGTTRCGNLVLNPGEACEIGMRCTNGSLCENCQCGVSLCSGSNLEPRISAQYDYANSRMFVNWSLLNACRPSVGYYSLFRCEGCTRQSDLGLFRPLDYNIPSTVFNYSDRPVEGGITYCYYVMAHYMDGRADGVSDVICPLAGHSFCINPHTREFCYDNDRYTCNTQNNLERIQDCGRGYCMPPDYGGRTRCVDQSICDYCNGLYGMFANLPELKVRIEGSTDYSFKWCNQSEISPLEGCYLDRTKTLFSAYKYCSNVTTCYNYKSKTTCEDPDTCIDAATGISKTGPCVWNYTQITKPELGGICRPKKPENTRPEQCELCDSRDFNWLSPSCTPEICKLFGDCYYIGKGSWHNYSCSDKKLLSCSDYNDSNRCIGGQQVIVDADYDADWNRIDGTHQVTPSNDDLELGKCYWWQYRAGYGLCVKDSDGISPTSFATGSPGWDCDSNDTMCLTDFDSPNTTILPRSGCGAGGLYGETVNLDYLVSDDRYPAGSINTYFCIRPQGNTPCYPANLGVDGTYTETMTSSGFYEVYYYSEDPAKNLEVVKSITIEVDASIPAISWVSPQFVCNLQTPQSSTLLLEGRISGGNALSVCAENTLNNRLVRVCQNNCAFNNTPGCITESGQFTLSVPINANSQLSNIIVFTQDSACNYFETTVQGACSGKLFPRLRINVTGYTV